MRLVEELAELRNIDFAEWPEWRKVATVRAIQINGPEDLPKDERVYLARRSDLGHAAVGNSHEANGFAVETLEGTHSAPWGAYLCVGVEGELWAVKRSIFEASYVEVAAEAQMDEVLNRERGGR